MCCYTYTTRMVKRKLLCGFTLKEPTRQLTDEACESQRS